MNETSPAPLERQPPTDPAAERAVLASTISDPETILRVAALLEPGDFADERHRAIYRAILGLRKRDVEPNVIALASELRRLNLVERAGGLGYLHQLWEAGLSPYMAEGYAYRVKDASVKRKLITLGGRISGLGYQDQEEAGALVGQAQGLMVALSAVGNAATLDGPALVGRWGRTLDDRVHNVGDGRPPGLPTGFAALDRVLGGLRKKQLVIVAARPSVGKSCFATDLIRNVAGARGGRVLCFSLEMDTDQIMDRIAGATLGINTLRIINGALGETELKACNDVGIAVSDWKLAIDETAGVHVLDLCNRARAKALAWDGLDLVIVDHLQLVQGLRADNRNLELGSITSALKKLAKELDCAVVVLSQLSRAVEERADRRPLLSDLRESGRIEEDADIVMLLYRDEMYNKPTADTRGIAEFNIAKNRGGPTGSTRLLFQAEHTRFVNLAERPGE